MTSLRPLFATAPLLLLLAAACGGSGASADAPASPDPSGVLGPDGDGGATNDAAPPPRGADLAVKVGSPSVAVRRGGGAKLPISLARSGFTGSVQLQVGGLPTGLTVAPLTVADAATTATLDFAAAATTALGKVSLTLHATASGLTADTSIEATVYDGEQLDPSFGTKGIATFATGTRSFFARAVTVLSDSKVVVAGDYDSYASQPGPPVAAFVRFASDGTLDTTFGAAGSLIPTPVSLGGYEKTLIGGVAADGAGGFVGVVTASMKANAGITRSDVLLLAVRADGTLDPAFGVAGVAKIDLGDDDQGPRLARDATGRWLVVSSVGTPSGRDAVVTRFLPNGQLDTTYGTSGRLRSTFGGDKPYGFETRAVGDALVLTGSRFQSGTNTVHGFVSRVTPAGAIDTTFGTSGTYDNTYQVLELDVASDGRAYLENGSALWRLLANGAPDLTYGPAGRAPQDGTELMVVPLAAAGGRVYRLLSGTGQPRMVLRSYRDDGTVDTAFGGSGSIVVEPSQSNAYPEATAITYTPDGRAVALGNRWGAQGFITVARFLL